jgi:hypothetical protein
VIITSRVIRSAKVEWRKLEWLQGEFKKATKTSMRKLKNSILMNQFIQPFNVWKDKKTGKVWILDGHHRKKAMEELEKEGHQIPKMMDANFIDCKNKQEAELAVMVYSSVYAEASKDSTITYISERGLDVDRLTEMVSLGFDLRSIMNDMSTEKPEIEFTQELMEEHNYVVLYFENSVDWLQAQTLLGLKTVKALDSKKGFEKTGIGRVIKGSEAIKKLMRQR